MSYRFKIGQQVTYNGPSQGGMLTSGDEVEIVRLGSDTTYYIVKLVGTFTTQTWIVKDSDLGNTNSYQLPIGLDYADALSYTGIDSDASVGYDDLIEKRKANGECTACGKKRPMSMFGLEDCSCTPQPQARW